MGVCFFGCRHHFIIRSAGIAHADIFQNRAALEPSILQHHAKILAQRLAANLLYRGAVYDNLTALHIVKAHEQVDQRGLAAAGRTNDCYTHTRLNIHRQILNQLAIRQIREANMLQFHFAVQMRRLQCALRIRRHRLFLNEFHDTRGAGQSILKLRHHRADVIKGLGVLVGIGQKAREHTHRDITPNGDHGAKQRHRRIHNAVYKAGGRVRYRRKEGGSHGILSQAIIDLIKLLLIVCLFRIGGHHFLVGDHLVNKARLLAANGTLLLKHSVRLLRNKPSNKEGQRRDNNHHQGDPHIDRQHKSQGADNRHYTGKQLGKAHQQSVGKLVRITDDPRDHIPLGVAVKIRKRQHQQFIKRPGAHISHHIIGDLIVEHIHHPLHEANA